VVPVAKVRKGPPAQPGRRGQLGHRAQLGRAYRGLQDHRDQAAGRRGKEDYKAQPDRRAQPGHRGHREQAEVVEAEAQR
jgi:hypothetical protein